MTGSNVGLSGALQFCSRELLGERIVTFGGDLSCLLNEPSPSYTGPYLSYPYRVVLPIPQKN